MNDPEKSWKISNFIIEIPKKAGKWQIQDFKKKSWEFLNDPGKSWKIWDCILKILGLAGNPGSQTLGIKYADLEQEQE